MTSLTKTLEFLDSFSRTPLINDLICLVNGYSVQHHTIPELLERATEYKVDAEKTAKLKDATVKELSIYLGWCRVIDVITENFK